MKKTILSTILLSGLVLSVAAPSALAEVSTKSGQGETEVNVNILEDKGHEENEGDYLGKLAIVWKPTKFDFEGSQSMNDFTLRNRHDKRDDQFIAVNDDRRETAADLSTPNKGGTWKLSGQLGDLTALSNNKSLNATMTFIPSALQYYDIGNTKDLTPEEIKDFVPKKIDKGSPTADMDNYGLVNPFNLKAEGDEVTFMRKTSTDDEGQGKRGVFSNLGNNEIRIIDKTGNNVGLYEGQITWTVSDQL